MPRGRDECWLEVNRNLAEDSGKRHPRVTCKHCTVEWTSNEKARVIEHLQRCPNLPESLWHSYQAHRLDPSLPSAQEIQQQQRARTRGTASISSAEQELAMTACAQWINASGLPPSVIEHPAFKVFVRTLRPAFKPPSRAQLMHALIDAPLMFIAYLADPHERLRRPAIVDSSEETQSRSLQTFLLRYCDNNAPKASNLLAMITLLRAKQGPFGGNMLWMGNDQIPPIVWWKNFWSEQQPDLAELCILALAIVPTTDTVERNWSSHNFVLQLKRNQLPKDMTNRLVATFWNLRIKHGWVDDTAHGSHEMVDHDAEFSPDMEGFISMQS